MPLIRVSPTTKIWLKFNGVNFRLPVNPEEVAIDGSSPSDSFSIIGLGQIDIPQCSNLRKIKFKSFFPGTTDAPYVFSKSKNPKYYYELLKKAMDEAIVGRIKIHRANGLDLNCRVTIKSLNTTDAGGNPEDLGYEIQFMEYRAFKPYKVRLEKDQTGKVTTVSNQVQRDVETPVMRVGATVVANGTYCYDSYGSKPHGTAKNLVIQVKRIVPGRDYPILIGTHGWIKESCLQIKS